MGYMSHHAIVVTSCIDALLDEAHAKATEIFGESVTPIVGPVTNMYRSFFVGPDGSKEGWDESSAGDARRSKFIRWMRSKCCGDGSSSLRWVEVRYGDDGGSTKALRSSDRDYKKRNASDGS